MTDIEISEEYAEEYQIKKHHKRLFGHKPVVMKELNTTFKDGFLAWLKVARQEKIQNYKPANLSDTELAQIKERAYKEAREHNANIKSQFKTKFTNLISRINSSISEREKESEKDFYKSSKLYWF